jgi:hypothetical protein
VAQGHIYGYGDWTDVKYLYCPRCKQLHVKAWFEIRNRCPVCFEDARVIDIPRNWMTYGSYLLYIVIPALILVYVAEHVKLYLYAALALLFVMMVLAYADIVRGEAYARERIKRTVSDSDIFNRRSY